MISLEKIQKNALIDIFGEMLGNKWFISSSVKKNTFPQTNDILFIFDNLILIVIICFLSGILTIILNRNNLLITLLGVELVLLSANLIFIFGSFIQNDPQGFMYVLCILTVSAVETGLGVAVLVFAYGTTLNTNYTKLNTLKN